jgi:hypothetical protein
MEEGDVGVQVVIEKKAVAMAMVVATENPWT